jgi:hypothetical protein
MAEKETVYSSSIYSYKAEIMTEEEENTPVGDFCSKEAIYF